MRPPRGTPAILASRGDLVVERDPLRPTGRVLRQGGMEASYVDLADPTHLEFEYMRWTRIALRGLRARRVLHVGGAACALARALAAEDPGGLQQVCELDAEVLAFAREHLGLRRAPGLRVRHAEGRAFIAGQADSSWDAIVIDAFIGARVPARLVTVEALRDAARVAPATLVNVVDDRRALEVHGIAAALAAAYPHVWKLGARTGNTIVVGGVGQPSYARIAAAAAADPAPARCTPPGELAPLLAGASPSRDEELVP